LLSRILTSWVRIHLQHVDIDKGNYPTFDAIADAFAGPDYDTFVELLKRGTDLYLIGVPRGTKIGAISCVSPDDISDDTTVDEV